MIVAIFSFCLFWTVVIVFANWHRAKALLRSNGFPVSWFISWRDLRNLRTVGKIAPYDGDKLLAKHLFGQTCGGFLVMVLLAVISLVALRRG
ncbi:MAG: hypothetical protein K8T25_10970 [Planctomycetia bacterium]|nr:hypothetical protein [Planctomycetia bacterium]